MSVTALANGNFIVTWQDASGTLGDTSGTSIKAQLFNYGAYNVITGTDAVDTMTGTTRDDHLIGLASNDTLSGLGGNDLLDRIDALLPVLPSAMMLASLGGLP